MTRNHFFLCSLLLFAFACNPQVQPAAEPAPEIPQEDFPEVGLYVRNGKICKDGHEYYGMGVNYLYAMMGPLEGSVSVSYVKKALARLSAAGIPYVRCGGCPYWPSGWKDTYLVDKEAYFSITDQVVAAAEEEGVGLIPSMFWCPWAIPDAVGEHMDQYAVDDSKTLKLIRDYTKDFVSRYKDSPAIWGWEFGNEFCNIVDIPHVYVPEILPERGTPATRDEVRDRLWSEYMIKAFKVWGETVRDIDPDRPLFSGNCEPRSAAWHNALRDPAQAWRLDTQDQYTEIVGRFECDPINTIECRLYCNHANVRDYPWATLSTPDKFVKGMLQIAEKYGKPLFIGEFAVPDNWTEDGGDWKKVDDQKEALQERMDAIVDNHVQLSCFWVYELPSADWDCNATFFNKRSWALEMVSASNRKLRKYMISLK